MTGFNADVRATVYGRASGICEICGDAIGQEYHHRRPRGMGGSRRDDTNTAVNCLLICGACHRLAESHRTVALLMGWLLPQATTNPSWARVMYRGEWRLLDTGGNVLTENGDPVYGPLWMAMKRNAD